MAINDFYGSYSRSKSDSLPVNKDFLEKMYTEYEKNIKYVLNNDIYTLFENNALNPSIIDALVDYGNNYLYAEDGFGVLCEKYRFCERDIYYFAYGIEAVNYFMDITSVSRGAGLKVTSCMVAVAGSLITTAGAASIATGWGLGLFLVGKAVSIYGMAVCAL